MNNSQKANGSHIQSWENIFDQTGGYIAVYIFVRSSVICGLVSYIFLTLYVGGKRAGRDFINTRLLIHKHVKISVDEWILETTRPQKHVKFLEQYIP